MKKLYFFVLALGLTLTMSAQNLLYYNNFNGGLAPGATIIGSGAIEHVSDAGFGDVFHNAVGGQAMRTNYLLITDTVFGRLQAAGTGELSIAFWVHKSTATDYKYTPLFSAYGAAPINNANTWPMMIVQTRLLAQVNCAGWTDLIPELNDNNKTNTENERWLADSVWHFYTATFKKTKVEVYVDGTIFNSWSLTDTVGASVNGLFTNGRDLKYVCLGGNQAWGWQDPDAAFMFDDLAIYSSVLTETQINTIIANKPNQLVGTKQAKGVSVNVYPNPASGYIKVAGITGSANVVISNMQGKSVRVSNNVAADNEVSLAGLAKGTYIVKVVSKAGTTVKKISVQ